MGHFELLFVTIGLLIFWAILDNFYPYFMGKIVNWILKMLKNMKTIGNISMTIYMFKSFFLKKWNHILFYLLATVRILILVIYLV